MTFGKYVSRLTKMTLSSSLAIGLVLAVALLFSGGVQGDISVEIGITPLDATWFLLAPPVLLTMIFVVLTPLSFFIHTLLLRVWPGDDV